MLGLSALRAGLLAALVTLLVIVPGCTENLGPEVLPEENAASNTNPHPVTPESIRMPPRPDLVLTELVEILYWDPVRWKYLRTVRAKVTNQGQASLVGPVDFRFDLFINPPGVGGTQETVTKYVSLTVGGSVYATFTVKDCIHILPDWEFMWQVMIDPSHKIPEVDEYNNSKSIPVVLHSCPTG